MSVWLHNICMDCWLDPKHQEQARRFDDKSKCCFCGKQNADGIYVEAWLADKALQCKAADLGSHKSKFLIGV